MVIDRYLAANLSKVKLQKNHHTGTSIFESIPNINMKWRNCGPLYNSLMKMPLKLSHGLLITNVIGRRFQKKKLLQQLKNITEPNTCWPSHDIKTFRNSSYDNYGTAREKARKAEFKSELNSDTERERENIKAPKRKIDSKMLFSCSDDSDKECINTKLPTPPIMQELESTSSVNTKSNKSKLKSRKLPDENTNKQAVYDLNSFVNTSNIILQNEKSKENNETKHVHKKMQKNISKKLFVSRHISRRNYGKSQMILKL